MLRTMSRARTSTTRWKVVAVCNFVAAACFSAIVAFRADLAWICLPAAAINFAGGCFARSRAASPA
jgi:hypothetical protein